jgi:hypothetical protein
MLLPSAADLVRAFIRDLGNVFDTGVGVGERPTRPICFESGGAAATITFRADRNYVLTGWTHPNGYNVAISTSGRASVPLGAGAARWSDGIFWLSTTSSQAHPVTDVAIPIGKDQVITVWIGAAAGAVVLFLREA